MNSLHRMRESNIAPFLTELQARVKGEGIRIGSYPQITRGVYVSLIGPDEKRVREVGEEVTLPYESTRSTSKFQLVGHQRATRHPRGSPLR